MTRICYVIPSMAAGGTERQLLHLIRGLSPDHDIQLVCTRGGGEWIGDVRRILTHVRILEMRGGWDYVLRSELRRVLLAHKFDIVHTFLFGFDLFANLAARDAGVPVVVSSRRELANWMRRRHVIMQRLANRYVDCITANSHAVAEDAITREHLSRDMVRVIYNGIPADDFRGTSDERQIRLRHKIPAGDRVIGLVANFSPVKDHMLFLATARELLRRRKRGLHFLMVGSGPLVGMVEKMIPRYGPEEAFSHVDRVTELHDLYAIMDVCVLCSKVEGFPNSVLEAMAAGTPVVAAATGGILEQVRPGDTGYLVEKRDAGAFADAIEHVLDRPEESAAVASRAAAYVRSDLTVQRMVDAHRTLYAELLQRKRGQ